MRILHVSKYYEPFKGGIEKVIYELATGSVKQGHEVVVVSSNLGNDYVEEEIEGVKVIRLPRWTVAFSQPLTFSFMWRLKAWMQWADVVQVHTPNPLAELSFLWQDINKPLVVTYHCDVVRQKKLHQIYKPVSEKLLARADKITVATPNHLKFSEPLQGHQAKATVIPFGVRAKHAQRTMAINTEMKAIKEKYGDYFLFVGRLVPYKGVDFLLRALEQTDEQLVIVGQGPRYEAWNESMHRLGLQDRVYFLGGVQDDNQFAAFMHGCKALVLPSIDESEAFGIVLIEAMSCQKPVITTKLRSGVPWVNDQGVSGLQVEPKNVEQLSQALRQLGENPEFCKKLGEQAGERFERLFRVDTMVQNYLNLYAEMLPGVEKVAA